MASSPWVALWLMFAILFGFQVAIGNIINQLHTARAEGSPDEMQTHFIVGFMREHGPVLRAFAVANVPRGDIWWDTIIALIDPDR